MKLLVELATAGATAFMQRVSTEGSVSVFATDPSMFTAHDPETCTATWKSLAALRLGVMSAAASDVELATISTAKNAAHPRFRARNEAFLRVLGEVMIGARATAVP